MALNTHQVTAVKNEIRLVKPLAPCFTSSKWHCGGGRFAVAAGVCVWTVAGEWHSLSLSPGHLASCQDLALTGPDHSMRKISTLATTEFAACCSTWAWLGGIVWFLSSPTFQFSLASCYGGEGLYFLIHFEGVFKKFFAKDCIRTFKRKKGSRNDTRDNTDIWLHAMPFLS